MRAATVELCAPLATEDYVVQSMPDASPAKWHLAHTSWFFEEFVLARPVADYRPHDERFRYLFNSYYNTVGPMHCRAACEIPPGPRSRKSLQRPISRNHVKSGDGSD